jgi:hypothetical protein
VEVLMNPELESQGIGSLPQQAPAQLPRIPSKDAYDAAIEAVGQIAPEAANQYRGAMRAAMSDVEIPPKVADILIAMFEYLIEHKDQYEQIVSTLVENGIVPPSMLPDHFDETYIGTRLAALHELKKDTAERAAPMEGMPMAQGGLANVTKYLQSQGRNGDTMLAHITPEEAQLLKAFGGSGSINPETGLYEFFNPLKEIKNAYKSVSNALAKVDDGLHKVVASPVGRLVATIGLTMIGVPPWLASAGLTAYSGGNIKDVLISGAMGYLGSGETIMGVSPLTEISKFMPGAAGSLLNSGLSSAALSTGAGLLQGQSLGQALKSGAMAGATTAGLQGLGLATPNKDVAPSEYQTLESLISAKGYDAGGNNAPQFIDGKLVPGSGQFQDFNPGANPPVYDSQGRLMSGFEPSPAQTSPVSSGGIPAPSMATPNVEAPMLQAAGPTAQAPTPGAISSVGGQSVRTGTTLSTSPVGQGTVTGTGLTAPAASSIVGRATEFFDKPSFDNFGKIFSDPNATTMLGKYGPGAAAVLGVTALAGGFKSEPATKNPAFNPQYTGMDYIRDNPHLFTGSLRTGQYLNSPPTVVPTNIMSGIPAPRVNAPIMPMYGGYKAGGNVDFPRKIGQIDGPGTATSDSIPAMLSDGEFVFTAKAVRNAGGGSRRKGAAKMYKLMKSLENGPLGG